MKDAVSVIVPVLEVDSYINECLESILKQTHKKIEVIMVTDGKKNFVNKICEFYAKQDKRFKRIITKSQDNKKNIGIREANAKYITFVDAGDRIAPTFIEDMLAIMTVEKADVVASSYYTKKNKCSNSKKYEVLESRRILDAYLHMRIKSYSFAKLYNKHIFDDIKYPKEAIFDDFATTYKLFGESSKVVFAQLKKYQLIEEKNNKYTDEDCMRKMHTCLDMLAYMEDRYPEFINVCKVKICCEAVDLFDKVESFEYKRQLFEYIKLYRNYVITNNKISYRDKMLVTRSLLGFNMMNFGTTLDKK